MSFWNILHSGCETLPDNCITACMTWEDDIICRRIVGHCPTGKFDIVSAVLSYHR